MYASLEFTQAIIKVMLFPPRLGLRSEVSLESRYGTETSALPCDRPASALIVLRSTKSDLLIEIDSSSTVPLAPVFD